jgi:FeS assembly SUF system protein
MKPVPMAPDLPDPSAGGGNYKSDALDGLVADPATTAALLPLIQAALKKVYDPEIPVDVWELGLIYDVFVTAGGVAGIRMTLTAPACPAAQILPGQVEAAAASVEGVTGAKVEIVWEPGWTKDRMSEAAKLQLGIW